MRDRMAELLTGRRVGQRRRAARERAAEVLGAVSDAWDRRLEESLGGELFDPVAYGDAGEAITDLCTLLAEWLLGGGFDASALVGEVLRRGRGSVCWFSLVPPKTGFRVLYEQSCS